MEQREKLQLEEAGDAATITVKYVNEVGTKYGPKLVFVGTDNTETPLIPDKTADKQLERIGLTRETAVGETLTFSRAANPSGKPYWNIDPAKAVKAPSKRLPPPERVQPFDEPTDEERFAQFAEEVEELNAPVAQRHAEAPSVKASSVAGLLTKYAELFRAADVKLKEAYGAKCPPDVVQSAVATVWIEANKRNLV